MPAPPPPPSSPKPRRPRLSRRWIIALCVLGAVLIGAAIGAFILVNVLRGGADSPEQAVTKSLDAVAKKDLVGVFTMVSPHERDAVVRVQDALVKKAKDVKLAEAARTVSTKGDDQSGTELTFDGIDVTFSGIQPTVNQLSEDVAVVRLSSGQIQLNADPSKTKGALRSLFDSSPDAKATEQKWDIRDLGPAHSGLAILATKADGRWYVNLTMSALEAINNYQGSARGGLPTSTSPGSDSPAAAAKALAQAVQTQSAGTVAPYLVKDEANALYLYGHLWKKLTSSSTAFSLGTIDFTDGPHEGNRAQAYVNQITVNTRSSDRFTVSEKCIGDKSSSGAGICLTGSAYKGGGYGTGGIDWISTLLSKDGKFAVTAVEDAGKWKVSVLDTLADHVIGAANSLTREQALALTGLARSEDPKGALTLGKASDLEFNSAGYAVTALKIEKPVRLQVNKQSTVGTVVMYGADGKSDVARVPSYEGTAKAVPAGDYKVVVWAGSDFGAALERDGNSARVSAPVTLSEYVEPATINGNRSSSNISVTSKDRTFSLNVPATAGASLRLSVTSESSSSQGLVATVDGKSYSAGGKEPKTINIPVGSGSHTLTLRTPPESSSSNSRFSYPYVYAELSIENK